MSKTDVEIIKDFGKKLENSGADYSEVKLREIFTLVGLNSDLIEKAVKDYERYREGELAALDLISGDEMRQLGAENLVDKLYNLVPGKIIVEDIIKQYAEYIAFKVEIIEVYQKTKDWNKVLSTVVYIDMPQSMEAFIDYIEEIYKNKVENVEHLKELTGLEEYENKEEIKLKDVIDSANFNKYKRSLETALKEGAKYKDLLEIKPEDYKLPKRWDNIISFVFTSDKYSTIISIISSEFLINEPAGLMMLPSLRAIAEEIEAPYSVLMDCSKLSLWGFNNKNDRKQLINNIKQKVIDKFPEFVKTKSKKWRDEWLLENEPDLAEGAYNDIAQEYGIALVQVCISDTKKTPLKCGEDIEKDIRDFFKDELKELKHILNKK